MLQLFENLGTRYMKGSSEYISKLDQELRKVGFLKSILCNAKDDIDEADIQKDITSHFILRLAFCQTDELKRWFIQQEVDVFRFKLTKISNDTQFIDKFLKDNDLNYEPISEAEKQSIMESLIEMGSSHSQVTCQSYYKIGFLEVIDLVKSRRAFIKNGFAYVTAVDFGSVLTHAFRARLSKGLTGLTRHLKEIEDDQRVADLLKILRERDVGENYADTKSKDHLTFENLDSLAAKSFPMCMRHLHDSLKQYHHLRHYGRLQYVLYLKGIGLPLEENLKMWRMEFSRGTIPKYIDKFDKEYAYNIRHSYGKEGKRTSYTPYSCMKIITSHLPGNNEHHGCPFKHFERDFLRQKLVQYGRSSEETHQIMEHSDSNNYQVACQRYFEYAHKTDELVAINHPNQYFEQSRRLLDNPAAATNNNNTRSHLKVEMTQ
jgi:DNA primase large subunit